MMFNKFMLVPLLWAAVLCTPSLLRANEKIVVRVDGLSCAFCAYGLEKNLKELEGVEKVEINLNRGTASLTVKEGKVIDDQTIKKVVKDSGFTPKEINRETAETKSMKPETTMEVIRLDVQGMTCMGCVYNVETSLKNVFGVRSVDVDLGTHSATVTAERGKVNPVGLVEEIEKAGRFKATVGKRD